MSKNDLILLTERVTKDFMGLRAIDNLDFTVKRGSIHGLIGPNGAGKTTFFNLVTGLLPVTTGKVYFDSEEVTNLKSHVRAGMGMSRTFQEGQLAPGSTVIDNVMVGAHGSIQKPDILGMFFRSKSTQEEKVKQECLKLLDLVGLLDSAEYWAEDLTWVERQLVQIARAIAAKPKLLLLDEPTSGMGPDESKRVGNIIRQIRDETSITIVVIAHDVRLVTDISDIITCINFGEKIAEGTPEQIQSDAQVLEAYLGSQ